MNTASEIDAILQAILRDPADDVARLVYADRIQDEGQESRAEFIRVQLEIARLEALQVAQFDEETDWWQCTGIAASWCPNCGDCRCVDPEESMSDDARPLHARESRHYCTERVVRKLEPKREREAELFSPDWLPDFGGQLREWYFSCFPKEHVPDRPFSFVVRRGFAEEVKLTCADFLKYAGLIFAAQPIGAVRLGGKLPAHGGTQTRHRFGWWRNMFPGWVEEPDLIPYEIWDAMPAEDATTDWKFFATSELALAALSEGCVTHGKEAAAKKRLEAA